MKIVIIGGTGLIGHQLNLILAKMGYDVVAAAPSTGVDTVVNQGLEEVLKNCQIVVDLSQPPNLIEQAALEFYIPSNKNLLAAERRAGTQLHIALSVVGIQNLGQSGYFRGKIAQEELIKSSGVPYTMVYSTQFHEFLGSFINATISDGTLKIPPIMVQPISSHEVALFLAEAVNQSQVNTSFEIGGPEKFTMEKWVMAHYQNKSQIPKIIVDDQCTFLGARIGPEVLLPSNRAKLGQIGFLEWKNSLRK